MNIKTKHSFLLALIIAGIIFIPFAIYEQGYFFFLGDFNVQQIPFYSLAHEAVRNGEVLWNFNTDLGANFIGSYSFYLLFSPFFWLTLPFPNSFVPFLIAPLLILKTACAALTSYMYISRFVKDKYYALLGSVLYAFSGFITYNIFFNHFHEVIVLFPLLLIGVEELAINNRRGVFLLAVAVNAMVNYWFFIGEVVFVIIYVLVRMMSPEWKFSVKKFLWIAFESVLGVLLVAVVLMPSVLAILGNPRTGADNLLNGFNFWIYWADQRQAAILQSLFFPPDLPSQPNFFPEHQAKWSSMNAWLPMISLSGVFAYLMGKRRSWLKNMLIICFVIALIPGFNSMFVLFNHSYYARWFYMPILLMSLASVKAFEDMKNPIIKRGIILTWAIIMMFIMAIGLTPVEEDGAWSIGLSGYTARFWVYSLAAIAGIAVTYVIFHKYKNHLKFKQILLSCVCATSILFSWGYITLGKCYGDSGHYIRDTAFGMRDELLTHQNSEEFVRTDFYDTMDNMGMYWQIPNIQAFHSIVPVSIMEFYPYVGVKRDVSSKPETSFYALRSMLSVKWQYVPENKDDEEDSDIYGFELWGSQGGFNIYENTNFIPMGFGYTESIAIDDNESKFTSNDMYAVLVLEDSETADKYGEYATVLEKIDYSGVSQSKFEENTQKHLDLSCYEFTTGKSGFSAKSNLDENVLMFFSVPYDKGWSATVNGEEAEVIKANVGFMAVAVPEGEAEIRFNYMPPGLISGGVITAVTALVFAGYMLYSKKQKFLILFQKEIIINADKENVENIDEEQIDE